jgi:small subunit ribosomal protein S1
MSPDFDNIVHPSSAASAEQSSPDSVSADTPHPDTTNSSETTNSAGSGEGSVAHASSEGAAAAPAPEACAPEADTSRETQAAEASSTGVTQEDAIDPETIIESNEMVSEGDLNATPAMDIAAADTDDDEISPDATMSELIEKYPTPDGKKQGKGGYQGKGKNQEKNQPKKKPEIETVTGTVVTLNDLGVVVDIGAKKEGLIPAAEFAEDALTVPPLTPGQSVEVDKLGEEKDGYALLSYQRPLRRATWKKIEEAFRTKATIEGTVTDLIKGGLVVDIGVRAFLPASQVDIRPQANLDSWKGQKISLRVLKLNRKRGNVVVSRRALLEEEQATQRKQVMESITEGQVLTGKVKNITDYGVFVDLGGVDGLLHITDLSWGRLKHPSEAVAAGDEIQVQVLHFDKEKGRVSLGRKQLIPDPWAGVPEKFAVGAHVKGKVVGVTDYGAFIELAPGVEALVHISEMTWSKKLKHPSKIVKAGDEVEAVVLEVKPDQRRISLGLKQTQPDPWEELAKKYPIGTIVTGKVRNLTEFGAFVEIEEGFDGLVHVSDISWSGRVKNPGDALKKGETITAKVLKIDAPTRRVSLGIKQVNDIWANWFSAHKINELVKGKVSRMAAFGAFVELAEGIEGLCHISEIEDRKRKGGDSRSSAPMHDKSGKPTGSSGETKLEAGKEYEFKIVKLDPDQHRIGLSFRSAQKQAEKRELQEYRSQEHKSTKSSPTATIGDMIRAKGGSL